MRKDFFGLIFVCLIGIFGGIKKSYRFALSFNANSCHPFVDNFVPSYASVARSAVFGRGAVLLVLAVCSQSKIFKSIVNFVAIYVVNVKAIRDFPKQQHPNHSMKFIGFGVDGHHSVSRTVRTASNGAFCHV